MECRGIIYLVYAWKCEIGWLHSQQSAGHISTRKIEDSGLKKTKMVILGLKGLAYIQLHADFEVQLES